MHHRGSVQGDDRLAGCLEYLNEHREEMAERMRVHDEAQRKKGREVKRRYYKTHRAHLLAYFRDYYMEHSEERKAYFREYKNRQLSDQTSAQLAALGIPLV